MKLYKLVNFPNVWELLGAAGHQRVPREQQMFNAALRRIEFICT